MKPTEDIDGKPVRVNGCDKAREWIHEACDERRALDAEQHVSKCDACAREAALLQELGDLLTSEPVVEPPAELVPSVMALVRADLARARRNARLAFAGALVALLLLALGITFFDVVGGALGLARDAASWVNVARDNVPAMPELPSVPAVGYGWLAGALALVIVGLEVRLLTRRAEA
jgi:hypothetical protein